MNRDSKIGMGCLILFFAPFAAVGVVTAVLTVRFAAVGEWGRAGFLSIFALVFGGVGFGFITVILRGRKRVSEIDRLKAQHPDEPWLWRPEWGAGRIESSTRLRMAQSAAFAALWNLISLPTAVLAVSEFLETRELPLLLILIFPAVGAGLIVVAVRAAVRYRKYGVSVFELAHVPGVVGRGIGGLVRTSAPIRPAEGFRVALVCVNRIKTGSGDDRSTSERVLWREDRTVEEVQRDPSGAGTVIPVAFRLPQDVRESDDSNHNNQIIWRVEVEADVPGVDYHVRFVVPVFRTRESETPLTPEQEAALAARAEAEPYRPPPDSPIRVLPMPRGAEIVFPAARNPAPALGLTAFTGVWSLVVWFLARSDAPVMFPILFGLFDVFLILAVLGAWLGHSRIAVEESVVVITRGLAFLTKTTTLSTARIARVQVKVGMQAGNTPYYDIVLRTTQGSAHKVASSIKDKREADWLADVMRRAAGIEQGV